MADEKKNVEITSALVKELREKTGAGMMDCKKALLETGGDIEKATDWLRQKGLATAGKKAGRSATEGAVVRAADVAASAAECGARRRSPTATQSRRVRSSSASRRWREPLKSRLRKRRPRNRENG